MGAAEGGEEVVKSVFVGDVDGGEVEIDFVALFVEDVFLAEGEVEEVAGGDAGRILVVVLGSGRGDVDRAMTSTARERRTGSPRCGWQRHRRR